jgi:hypothetical protein
MTVRRRSIPLAAPFTVDLVPPLPIWREDECERVYAGRCGNFAREESSPKFAGGGGGIVRKIARHDFTDTVASLFCCFFYFFTDSKWVGEAVGVVFFKMSC